MRSAKWVRLVAIGALAAGGAVMVVPVSVLLGGLYSALDATWQVVVNFLGFSLVAFFLAGLLSPLEALGWWAGWYGEGIETKLDPGTLVKPLPIDMKASRFVIYMDGIAQTNFEYLPDAAIFLSELERILPDDILIVKGLIPYSVLNRPLTQQRILSFFWRLADRLQMSRSGGLIGLLIAFTIQLRNLTIVAVSADSRYGPIYNQGTAGVMYNSLISHGYQPESGVPITLVGYSGGAQIALGAAPYLRKTLDAPIEVISLAGVFSGNNNLLKLEHFYHFVGDRDLVERIGAVLFPRRWKVSSLSYWNRAKQRGKVTIASLGPVGHTNEAGPFGRDRCLPDGRSFFQQTLDNVTGIIQGSSPLARAVAQGKPSNYDRYQAAPFNHPEFYPLDQTVDPDCYRPIADWQGRLILPALEERSRVNGAWLEVHHAEPNFRHLVGQRLMLRWSGDAKVQAFVKTVTKDVHFSEEANYSQLQGIVHPERIDHWQRVNPLESLAGGHPQDDVLVALPDAIVAFDAEQPILYISEDPVQITGRFYALVKFLQPIASPDAPDTPESPELPEPNWFKVAHFDRDSRQFTGKTEILSLPSVIADANGVLPSTTQNLSRTPLNAEGWYVYGAKSAQGYFVVQAIAPRALLRLQPDRIVQGKSDCWQFVKHEAWQHAAEQKGSTRSVLLCPEDSPEDAPEDDSLPETCDWQLGDRALLIHTYGGIGGKQKEPAAATPLYFGHFAYGSARVIREPLADELSFDIYYHQVYTHNTEGLIAGTLAWHRYLGDRQFGWLGVRPVCDILIKLESFTADFEFRGVKRSALDLLIDELQAMTARYRIGDGTGGTYVGAAHNCAQDSNQALYASLKKLGDAVNSQAEVQAWLTENPGEADRFFQLMTLARHIRRDLLPFGSARADWQTNPGSIGISPEEDAIQNLLMGLRTWRTLLPRLASETIARLFLEQNATLWVLRTNQVGGYNPNIEPIAPTPIGW